MKRVVLLMSLLAVGSVSVGLSAYQQAAAGQPAPKVLEVEKLKDNLFVLRAAGSGGNTAVFVTTTGVVVVDTKNPGWGQPILDKIRELTDKPVTMIINTHTHGDHVSGNVEFPPTVDVVTQQNTKVNMAKMISPNGPPAKPTPTIFETNGGRGLPKRTFKGKMTIGRGSDRIDLRYFGRGHTNGDAWVVFPALRIMHAGDIFSGKNIPILDGFNGGSGVEMPETLSKAADYATKEKIEAIITGHSTQMTVADLREYSAFNEDFLTAVKDAKKAGTSAEALAASWNVPAKYAGYAAPQAARLKSNIEVVMKEVK
jgi:glyoxylase-like metal-dependent hydrolase (beta-lactamase superfamily II)